MSKPAAAISVNHTLGIAPLGCVFTDASTGVISGRVWSFGDGQTSDKKSPHHEYQETGDFTATLTVWNSDGASSATVVISVTANDNPVPTGVETSLMDIVPAVRRILRGPSDLRLHYTAIIETIFDILRGYMRDLGNADFDDQKDEAQAHFSFLGDETYLLTVPNSPELELVSLFYEPVKSSTDVYTSETWSEIQLVPLNYYAERNLRETRIAALFGGLIVANGSKIKINLPRDVIEAANWKVITRFPLLQKIEMQSPIKLRADFMRMLKVEAAIKLMPQIRDDSPDFRQWKADTTPLYMAELVEWRRRWDEYLKDKDRPQFAPKIPANEYRYKNTRRRHPVERWRS